MNPPAILETWVPSLGGEDALEKEMATHLQYSYLGNPMDRGTWQATVHEAIESDTNDHEANAITKIN